LRTLTALCVASVAMLAHSKTGEGDINHLDKLKAWPRGDEPVIAHQRTLGVCLLPIGQRSYPAPYPVVLAGPRSEVTAMVNRGMLAERSCAVHQLQNLKVNAKPTAPKHAAKHWKAGSNDELVWVQYVEHETEQPFVSFFRWADTQKVEIRVHGLDPTFAINQEVPRFAAFTLRTGQGKGTITLEGMGQVGRDDEGNLVFSSKRAAASKNIESVRKLISRVGNSMTISMESITLKLPVDKQMKTTLQSLLSR
jgi:hypothetical protein